MCRRPAPCSSTTRRGRLPRSSLCGRAWLTPLLRPRQGVVTGSEATAWHVPGEFSGGQAALAPSARPPSAPPLPSITMGGCCVRVGRVWGVWRRSCQAVSTRTLESASPPFSAAMAVAAQLGSRRGPGPHIAAQLPAACTHIQACSHTPPALPSLLPHTLHTPPDWPTHAAAQQPEGGMQRQDVCNPGVPGSTGLGCGGRRPTLTLASLIASCLTHMGHCRENRAPQVPVGLVPPWIRRTPGPCPLHPWWQLCRA